MLTPWKDLLYSSKTFPEQLFTGVHFATAIEHLAKVTPCERPIEHLAKVQKRFRASHRRSRICRVAQGWFVRYLFVVNTHGKV